MGESVTQPNTKTWRCQKMQRMRMERRERDSCGLCA